jgi:glutamate mutase epsilon subunit
MPWVEFEPMIPVFERAKTVHALDLAAIVIGTYSIHLHKEYIAEHAKTNSATKSYNIQVEHVLTRKCLWKEHYLMEIMELGE